MANQAGVIACRRADGSSFQIRFTAVDTADTAATFTDYGAASSITIPPGGLVVEDVKLVANTATVTALQPSVDSVTKPVHLLTAFLADATTTPNTRIGTGFALQAGSTFELIGRA